MIGQFGPVIFHSDPGWCCLHVGKTGQMMPILVHADIVGYWGKKLANIALFNASLTTNRSFLE